jgi:DNA-binding IclR family transcriptional regulator
MAEDNRRLGPDIARPADPQSVQKMVLEVRKHGLSRSVNNPTPGVCCFAAPVLDYSGNFVLGITLMGRSSSFDQSWDGPQAKAVKACGIEVSKRLGHQSTRAA